jgi:hypothetical protein
VNVASIVDSDCPGTAAASEAGEVAVDARECCVVTAGPGGSLGRMVRVQPDSAATAAMALTTIATLVTEIKPLRTGTTP